ncbi:MAG: sigma-70 family RNA polymerase sigma factor, partial [Oscillospiraceae bacterium]|nr:sigma-70 family RNA polymerase sigma factor [Oscillospiraceae bacterium]
MDNIAYTESLVNDARGNSIMENILRAYGDMVYRVAVTHTATREDAEDASQEVFLAYARKRPEFNGSEHAKAWFLKVTLRVCAKARVSQKKQSALELHGDIPAQGMPGGDVWLAFMS